MLFVLILSCPAMSHPRRFFVPQNLATEESREAFFRSMILAFPSAFHQERTFDPIDQQMLALQRLVEDDSIRGGLRGSIFSAAQDTVYASISPQPENHLATWAEGRRLLAWLNQWRNYSLRQHRRHLERWSQRMDGAGGLLHGLIVASTEGYSPEAKNFIHEELGRLLQGKSEMEEEWVRLRVGRVERHLFRGRWPSRPQKYFTALIRARRQFLQGSVAYALRMGEKRSGVSFDSRNIRPYLAHVVEEQGKEVFEDFSYELQAQLYHDLRRFAYRPMEAAARSGELYRFRGELVSPPLSYFLARGRIGRDCSTNHSAIMAFLRSERAVYIQNNGRIYGYAQWALTQVDGRDAIYLHTIQAPGLKSRELRDLLSLIRTYAVGADQLSQKTRLFLPEPDRIRSLMHFHQGELRRLASEGIQREQTYEDVVVREALKRSHSMTYSYDQPQVNRLVRELDLPDVLIQLRREASYRLEEMNSVVSAGDQLMMRLFVQRSRFGKDADRQEWQQLRFPVSDFRQWRAGLSGRVELVAWMDPRTVLSALERWLFHYRKMDRSLRVSVDEAGRFLRAVRKAFPRGDRVPEVEQRNRKIHHLAEDFVDLTMSKCEVDLVGES